MTGMGVRLKYSAMASAVASREVITSAGEMDNSSTITPANSAWVYSALLNPSMLGSGLGSVENLDIKLIGFKPHPGSA